MRYEPIGLDRYARVPLPEVRSRLRAPYEHQIRPECVLVRLLQAGDWEAVQVLAQVNGWEVSLNGN